MFTNEATRLAWTYTFEKRDLDYFDFRWDRRKYETPTDAAELLEPILEEHMMAIYDSYPAGVVRYIADELFTSIDFYAIAREMLKREM